MESPNQLGFPLSVLGVCKVALQYQVQQLVQSVSKDNQIISQILPGTLPGLGQRGSYCDRQYTPYIRAVKTQKSCGKAAYRKKQKRESQATWLEHNPDYFRGRYISR